MRYKKYDEFFEKIKDLNPHDSYEAEKIANIFHEKYNLDFLSDKYLMKEYEFCDFFQSFIHNPILTVRAFIVTLNLYYFYLDERSKKVSLALEYLYRY